MVSTIVAAISQNGVIGRDGGLPWDRVPEDMARFRDLTMGRPVIMGRKTLDSIPEKFRPLKGRKNIVLSNTLESSEGIYVARSIDEAVKMTEGEDYSCIGGSIVYEQFLPLVDRMEITLIHRNFQGDAYLPLVDFSSWNLTESSLGFSNKANLHYSFLTYCRK
ncbi:MAG: dihydrofolate reductase [Nanoarchaeota archaeon]|nr:dihydrofolate reductase [Nanoarchaeota archaeon]